MKYFEKIKEIITDINPYEDIENDTELIESGILDSVSILVLVTELEDCFDIEISEKHINPENFSTIASISRVLEMIIGN